MNTLIEIQRNNVTVAEFLNYVKKMCQKKGMDIGFSREDFEKPVTEYMISYNIIDGKKHVHFADYRTTIELKRKHASYTTSEGFTRYYYTNELKEVEKTELVYTSQIWPADDAPCKAETVRSFAYDHQTYVLYFDGTCYNEICEFSFNDEKRGFGYYYQINADPNREEV